MKGSVLLLIAVSSVLSLQASENTDARMEASRGLADSLQGQLGIRLKAALTIAGPVAAISVCQMDAGVIAEDVSRDTPAKVGRTALKVRNPDNTPDERTRSVLRAFQQQIEQGEAGPLENFETAEDGSARYMRSIVTQPLCLTCHGSEMTTEVKAAIDQSYPQDQATGFAVGELRGAFIVDWPASSSRVTLDP